MIDTVTELEIVSILTKESTVFNRVQKEILIFKFLFWFKIFIFEIGIQYFKTFNRKIEAVFMFFFWSLSNMFNWFQWNIWG